MSTWLTIYFVSVVINYPLWLGFASCQVIRLSLTDHAKVVLWTIIWPAMLLYRIGLKLL